LYIFVYTLLIHSYMKKEKQVYLHKNHEMPKRQIGIRLDDDLIKKLKKEAKIRNRSVTNLIETILKKELDLL